ncbi:hypothetical protein F8S13_25185 [Chloroflexia bacterium SDU3-3]|nr:hypothetical protein F8S13_25185 [Chloroflexia bacterium SDU3-3]
MTSITLAATNHDPDGRLYEQTARMLPRLAGLFPQITVLLTSTSQARSEALLREAGCDTTREPQPPGGLAKLGEPRRSVIRRALELGAGHVVFCDFDRMLHWAEHHPAELAATLDQIAQHDFTVLARTPRAFASHPRCQRDTESTINTAFAAVSGLAWDTGAGARGLSRRAAEAILAGCSDTSVGVDVAWPLFLLRQGGFDVACIPTEGMEFETADRFGDQVAALGGLAAWIDRLDADPRQWALRLDVARVEVESLFPFS